MTHMLTRFLLNAPFRSKVIFLTAIPVVSLMFLLICILVSLFHHRDSQRWALHAEKVLLNSERVLRRVNGMTISAQAYVMDPKEVFLQEFARRRQFAFDAVNAVVELVRDNAEQSEVSHGVGLSLKDYVATLERVLQFGGEMSAVERQEQWKKSEDEFRAVDLTLRQLIDKEEQIRTKRLSSLVSSFRRTIAVVFGGSLVWLTLALIAAYLFSSITTTRLVKLRQFVIEAEKDPGKAHRATEVDGEDELGDLSRAFRSLVGTVTQRTKDNETFVYSVSHDMRAPLLNLQGFSAELELSIAGVREKLRDLSLPREQETDVLRILDEDLIESARFIRVSATRLGQIIDSLLRLSRVGRIEPKIELVNVQDLVESIFQSLRGSLDDKQATYRVYDIPQLLTDAQALQQLLLNLISNAVKYLSPERPGLIEVGLSPSDPTEAVLYVKDNGRGIPEEFFSRLFMPFQRYHVDAAEGEGMGLAMVSQIVHRLRGEIWVESVPATGSTFFIRLPLSYEGSGSESSEKTAG